VTWPRQINCPSGWRSRRWSTALMRDGDIPDIDTLLFLDGLRKKYSASVGPRETYRTPFKGE